MITIHGIERLLDKHKRSLDRGDPQDELDEETVERLEKELEYLRELESRHIDDKTLIKIEQAIGEL